MTDSPFRTQVLHCPRCPTTELTAGELRHCTTCKGAWIPEQTLAEHVGAMQVEMRPKLDWEVSKKRIGLSCASCRQTMETLLLFGVPVDRCHSHGVWFDKDELAETLRRSASHTQPTPVGNNDGAWVAADVAGEVAIDTAVVATSVAIEATPGILEGVLDVIAGIFSAIDF